MTILYDAAELRLNEKVEKLEENLRLLGRLQVEFSIELKAFSKRLDILEKK